MSQQHLCLHYCVAVLLYCVSLTCSFVDLRTRTGFSALHYATFWGFIGETYQTLNPARKTLTFTLNHKASPKPRKSASDIDSGSVSVHSTLIGSYKP